MKYFLEILLILTAFISVIPAVNIYKNSNDKKYICLKALIYVSAFWTILIFFERASTSAFIIYYSKMLGYPLKFLLAGLSFCTIFQYIEKKFSKILIAIFTLIFLVDLGIALMNSETLWFLQLKASELVTFSDLYTAANGPLFIFHLLIIYIILIVSIGYMFIFLAKKRGIRQYKSVTRMLAISVIAVLVFNITQFFVKSINVDLTYISLIFVTYILYNVIYKKDMVFNLRTSGRDEILTNMREIYILTDNEKRIVEISPLLLEKYQINKNDIIGKSFENLVSLLEDKVFFYSEYNMNDDKSESKDHYHLREKKFKLKGMNVSGYMILLYDETQVYKLLRELNKLSNYDMMTGLNNRNYIENKLEEFKDTKNLGVLSLDLNGLKVNNDYLGHERGDFLLKSLAFNMKSIFKDINGVEMARIGGDEFLIIIPNTNLEELNKRKNLLLKKCNHKDIDKLISVSIGVSIDTLGEKTIYQLIQLADQDMYEMKAKSSSEYKKQIIEYIEMQNKFVR